MSRNSDFWDLVDVPSNQFDPQLSKAYYRVLDALNSRSEAGWTDRGSKDNVDIYTRYVEGSPYEQVKGIGYIDGVTPEEVIEIFIDPDHRSMHDPTAHRCTVLYEIDRLTRIEYSTFSAPWPVAFRDLIAVGRVRRMDNGALLNYATSLSLEELPKESIDPALYAKMSQSSKVRAQLEFYGLLVTPVQPSVDGRPRCQVMLVASTNPGGILPAWLTNTAQLNQPLCIHRAQEMVNSRPDLIQRIQAGLPLHYATYGFPASPVVKQSKPESFSQPLTFVH